MLTTKSDEFERHIIWQLNNNRSGETKPYASKNTVNSTNDNVQFWNFHKKGVPTKIVEA